MLLPDVAAAAKVFQMCQPAGRLGMFGPGGQKKTPRPPERPERQVPA